MDFSQLNYQSKYASKNTNEFSNSIEIISIRKTYFEIGCGNRSALIIFDDLPFLPNISNVYNNVHWNITLQYSKWI